MKRVFFFESSDYKRITPHTSDPDFIPLSVKNDHKAQKNGTKKTVYWVKKKPRAEDGTVKGETWTTSQQYIGDWKNNKKEGYGIKIMDNKDKYEGNWKFGMRHGKGTYWVCIGKNKYRKLYTGDWFENKKDGGGIYFYSDGSCYDGNWKNSKRDGRGLMIYSNGDVYEGAWLNDLKHGYGVLEKKSWDKYYGYWNEGLKEGSGYFYYSSTGKIYLGEWHEDVPRCGIFTDVDDENISKELKKHFKAEDAPPLIPILRLKNPESILENSINTVHFVRVVKLTKTKTLHELFPSEIHPDLITLFTQKKYIMNTEEEGGNENKTPDNLISIKDFKLICLERLGVDVSDETLQLILYIFETQFEEETKIDFLMFARLFYLMNAKQIGEDEYAQSDAINLEEADVSGFNEDKIKEIEMLTNGMGIEGKKQMNFDYSEYKEDMEYREDEEEELEGEEEMDLHNLHNEEY